MKFQFFYFNLMILFFTFMSYSCKNNHFENPDNNWRETNDTSSIFIYCLDFDKIISKAEFIIRNQEEYDNLDTLKSKPPLYKECMDYVKPVIDFSKYSLLGFITMTGPFDIKRHVYINDIEKKYLYKINIKITSNNAILYVSKNFILVPKIPYGYEVEIDTALINPYY
jgi:hypothetical protein